MPFDPLWEGMISSRVDQHRALQEKGHLPRTQENGWALACLGEEKDKHHELFDIMESNPTSEGHRHSLSRLLLIYYFYKGS